MMGVMKKNADRTDIIDLKTEFAVPVYATLAHNFCSGMTKA